jgi:hypothetical protein
MAENTIKTTKTVINEITEITGSDPVTILTADEDNDQRVSGIFVASDDTSAQDLTLYLEDASATLFPIGVVEIPAGSGTDGTNPIVDLMEAFDEFFKELDNADNRFFNILANCSLKAVMDAVTADKTFTIAVVGSKYDS